MATNNNKNSELDMTQRALISLYRESLKLRSIGKSKSHPFRIILGDETDLADGTLDDSDLERKKQNFEILKNESIISKFTGPFWEYEHPDTNPDFSDYYCYITGEFYPDKVIRCLEKIWKPKQELSEEIVMSYRKLTELVQTYFSKPISENVQIAEEFDRKSNELYRALSNRIAELFQILDTSLINTNDGFLFFTGPYIPFTSLFSAQKELKKKRMTIESAMANMTDFYGKLIEVENSFKLETYKKPKFKLETVSNHINQLKNIKNSADKHTIPHFPLKVNSETKWEDITIKFINISDIEISIGKTKHITNYAEIGFSDQRVPNQHDNTSQKQSWKFLILLATGMGSLDFGKLTAEEKTKCKKQKQELSNILKSYFSLPDDPFEKYDKDKAIFKIKINLIPDKDFREDFRDRKIYDSNNPFEDLDEVMDDQLRRP